VRRKLIFIVFVLLFILVVSPIVGEAKGRNPIPKGYYTVDLEPDRTNTYTNLEKYMKNFFHIHRYKRDVYDCSEMSAFLEHMLEDAGFDAYIAIKRQWGKNPKTGKIEGHAWVLVKTKRTTSSFSVAKGTIYRTHIEWVPIETTDGNIYNLEERPTGTKVLIHIFWRVGIVTPWNSNYKEYFKYDELYSSIYDIPEPKLYEYDWWKSFY